MKVVDSSVWISLFSPDDRHHDDAKVWFSTLPPEEVLAIPALALIEVAAVLARAGKKGAAIDRAIEHMRKWSDVCFLDELNTEIAIDVAKESKVRGADAVFLATAKRLSATLVSFDVEQVRRAGMVRAEIVSQATRSL